MIVYRILVEIRSQLNIWLLSHYILSSPLLIEGEETLFNKGMAQKNAPFTLL